jgi:hypothetical protein
MAIPVQSEFLAAKNGKEARVAFISSPFLYPAFRMVGIGLVGSSSTLRRSRWM